MCELFESEALNREYLLAGCVAQGHEHQLQDDEFGGVVTVFVGADVNVTDLISSGFQYVQENR